MAKLGQCYILKLKRGKWYVGYTERGIERILDHIENKGAKWTKEFEPVKPIPFWISEPGQRKAFPKNKGDNDEDSLTLDLMKKHGIHNVRGGSWCMVKLRQKTIRELEGLISKPKKKSKTKKLPKKKSSTSKSKKGGCDRCGHSSHTREKCRAKTTIDGVKITTDSWVYRPKGTPKKKTTGSKKPKKTKQCQARTKNGYGARCRRKALPGGIYCNTHAPKFHN